MSEADLLEVVLWRHLSWSTEQGRGQGLEQACEGGAMHRDGPTMGALGARSAELFPARVPQAPTKLVSPVVSGHSWLCQAACPGPGAPACSHMV